MITSSSSHPRRVNFNREFDPMKERLIRVRERAIDVACTGSQRCSQLLTKTTLGVIGIVLFLLAPAGILAYVIMVHK